MQLSGRQIKLAHSLSFSAASLSPSHPAWSTAAPRAESCLLVLSRIKFSGSPSTRPRILAPRPEPVTHGSTRTAFRTVSPAVSSGPSSCPICPRDRTETQPLSSRTWGSVALWLRHRAWIRAHLFRSLTLGELLNFPELQLPQPQPLAQTEPMTPASQSRSEVTWANVRQVFC